MQGHRHSGAVVLCIGPTGTFDQPVAAAVVVDRIYHRHPHRDLCGGDRRYQRGDVACAAGTAELHEGVEDRLRPVAQVGVQASVPAPRARRVRRAAHDMNCGCVQSCGMSSGNGVSATTCITTGCSQRNAQSLIIRACCRWSPASCSRTRARCRSPGKLPSAPSARATPLESAANGTVTSHS